MPGQHEPWQPAHSKCSVNGRHFHQNVVLSGIAGKISTPLSTSLCSSLAQNGVRYPGLTLPFHQPSVFLVLDIILLLMQPKLALPSLALLALGTLELA